MPEKGRATSSLLALSTVGWLMATLPALGAEPSKPGDLQANPGARLLASDLVVFGRSLSPVVVGAQVGGSDGTLASPPQTVLTHPIAAPSDVSDNRRPLGLVLLFASYSSVQTLDFNLTMRAVNAGATERNPFIAALVERPEQIL